MIIPNIWKNMIDVLEDSHFFEWSCRFEGNSPRCFWRTFRWSVPRGSWKLRWWMAGRPGFHQAWFRWFPKRMTYGDDGGKPRLIHNHPQCLVMSCYCGIFFVEPRTCSPSHFFFGTWKMLHHGSRRDQVREAPRKVATRRVFLVVDRPDLSFIKKSTPQYEKHP